MPVLPEKLNSRGKTHFEFGWCLSKWESPRLNERRELRPAFISALWLWIQCSGSPQLLLPRLPCHRWTLSSSTAQTNSSLKLLLTTHFVTMTSKLLTYDLFLALFMFVLRGKKKKKKKNVVRIKMVFLMSVPQERLMKK